MQIKIKRAFAKKTENMKDALQPWAKGLKKLEDELPKLAKAARKLKQLLKDYDGVEEDTGGKLKNSITNLVKDTAKTVEVLGVGAAAEDNPTEDENLLKWLCEGNLTTAKLTKGD